MNIAKVIKDENSESGISLKFPEGLVESLNWQEGDIIEWSFSENKAVLINKTYNERQESLKNIEALKKHYSIGDTIHIPSNSGARSNHIGHVEIIDEEGVGLDFRCNIEGISKTAPSQEFWTWEELNNIGIHVF